MQVIHILQARKIQRWQFGPTTFGRRVSRISKVQTSKLRTPMTQTFQPRISIAHDSLQVSNESTDRRYPVVTLPTVSSNSHSGTCNLQQGEFFYSEAVRLGHQRLSTLMAGSVFPTHRLVTELGIWVPMCGRHGITTCTSFTIPTNYVLLV